MIYRLVFLKEILSFSFSACILYIYLSPLWIVGHLMAGNSPFEEIRVGRWNLNHTQKCFSPYLMLLNLWAYKCANCVLSPKPWSPHWTRLLFLVYHAEPNKRRVTKFATESLYSGTSTKKSEECKNWLEDSWNGKEVVEMLDLEKVWLEENRLSLESLLAGKMGRVAAFTSFWANSSTHGLHLLEVHLCVVNRLHFSKEQSWGSAWNFGGCHGFNIFVFKSLRLHCHFQNNHTWKMGLSCS